MKRIGLALHYSRMGNLVIKLAEVPPLYINVYTYTMKKVGTLYDVIGNVKNPYGLVKPVERNDSIIGQPLYVKVQDMQKKRR
ncbi:MULTISPECIES: Gar1/Naf1 family protein [Pyrobaculum]|uniref:snoRNP protein GAR1 n=3 Tax=Pyrobaculum TaxID=2276 RepID=A4WLM8_PYRAR|nr:Gar1/Naf1 family protein [Pyrobaculum arsenaticum]ABP51295.1 snoRNP protein GAR1 [Pyrobaculum arsenaticum DSM 13514]AFA38415.1 RNA-binding protein involved in rRNA processing [Pyrobaculum oguniense TE7]MCY0889478.1 Gar1/Naf1 family protein [Pyrobaculum arsenaticum]NYR16335.1 H/ACA RNA-protein complex protein Gar1 [Pyrobaculum arsenaticum]